MTDNNRNNNSEDKTFRESQAHIQSQAQSQSLEYIMGQRKAYAEDAEDRLSKESTRLSRIHEQISRLEKKSSEKRDAALNKLDNILQSSVFSTESINEINQVSQRSKRLAEIGSDKLAFLDTGVGQGYLDYQYNIKALNGSNVNYGKNVTDILLGDDNFSNAQRSRLNDLKQEFEACKRKDNRVYEYFVELAKTSMDHAKNIGKL